MLALAFVWSPSALLGFLNFGLAQAAKVEKAAATAAPFNNFAIMAARTPVHSK